MACDVSPVAMFMKGHKNGLIGFDLCDSCVTHYKLLLGHFETWLLSDGLLPGN